MLTFKGIKKTESVHSNSLVLKLGGYLRNRTGRVVNSPVKTAQFSGFSLCSYLLLSLFPLPHPTIFKITKIVCTYLFSEKNFKFGRKYVVLLLKEGKCDRGLFSFVATLQQELHSERSYISFYLFCINSNNNKHT